MAFPLTACGNKGRLKSPSQIEAAQAKKARRDAKEAAKANQTKNEAPPVPEPTPPEVSAPQIDQVPQETLGAAPAPAEEK